MKFNFAVGKAEAHELEFTLDRVSGDLKILLDGTKVVQDSQKQSADLDVIRRYELNVGEAEKHKVAFMVAFDGKPDDQGKDTTATLTVTTTR